MKIECNLYSQWIALIRNAMLNAGFDHSSLSDQDCAVRWQSWQRRIVLAEKRNILKTDGFSCPSYLRQGLKNLEHAFIEGLEIWPWQSELIDRPTFEDGLYNDYHVTHFHLGLGYKGNSYINRTKELLFSVVHSTAVYEIGIYNHGDWYELDILDIIDANWPSLLDSVTIPALDVSHCLRTREEVKNFREANINAMIKLKSGRIIFPLGGGVAMDGTSNEAVRSAMDWANVLRDDEKRIVADIKEQVQRGLLEEKDYVVRLLETANEISGVIEGRCKWILWKRT